MNLSEAAANARIDAVTALLDRGALEVLDASARVLATCTFGAPAFDPARKGVAVARAIEGDDDIAATGTAASFRALSADGGVVFTGTVGVGAGFDIVVDTTSLQAKARFVVSGFSYGALP